ncbi:MAG TPA: hypothetical protein VF806_05665, partial [Anaerolineaceae bacterium]
MNLRSSPWFRLAGLVVLAVYGYWFMEWLFEVTKPSFMDAQIFWTKLALLALPALLTAGLCLLGLGLVLAASGLLRWRGERFFLSLGSLIPALFLAFTVLMMLDNFTYTVFKLGVVSTHGYQRGLYGIFFLLLLGGAWVWVRRQLSGAGALLPRVRGGFPARTGAALLLFSLPLGGSLFWMDRSAGSTALQVTPT